MDKPMSSPTAIGVRFRAGLQSMLSGIVKSGSVSPQKQHVQRKMSAENGILAVNGNSKDITEVEHPHDDLLGESEHDEIANESECDDALLEGVEISTECVPTADEPLRKKMCFTEVKQHDLKPVSSLPKTDRNAEIVNEGLTADLKSKTSKINTESKDKKVDIEHISDVKISVNLQSNDALCNFSTRSAEGTSNTNESEKLNCVVMQSKNEIPNNISSSNGTSTNMETNYRSSSEPKQTEKQILKPVEPKISPEEPEEDNSMDTVKPPSMDNSVFAAPKGTLCSSPEGNRSADSDGLLSPPAIQTSKDNCSSSSDNSENSSNRRTLTPPTDNEYVIEESVSDDDSPSRLAIKNTMDDMLGKTVTSVDGDPISSVCAQRASPHVSPSNSDDEGDDLLIGATSAEEISDDDSRNSMNVKRAKLSPSAEGGRLNKLISHLSTALVDDNSSRASLGVDEDGEAVNLKKNGLASFYDVIIKKEVVRDTYHKELLRKHQELQVKNSMDCRKIAKILHEVKVVREKLKQMNARPTQRSVSTQIFSDKLQVPPDQTGNVIIKSTVLSQKALVEVQRRMEYDVKQATSLARDIERKNATAEMMKRAPIPQTALTIPQHLPSRSLTATQSPILSRPLVPTLPPLNALPAVQSPHKSVHKPPPNLLPKPLTAHKSESEVIDLTDEDPVKSIASKPSIANVPVQPLAARNGINLFNGAVPLHPAPLPQCPLTGKPGHLAKPPLPILELNSKEDGIVLQWSMNLNKMHAKISTYQIFGYKERPGPLSGSEWKKVGDLKALPLPMACTLTQFQTGHRYHFAVRAVDELGRTGPFGAPRSTRLG